MALAKDETGRDRESIRGLSPLVILWIRQTDELWTSRQTRLDALSPETRACKFFSNDLPMNALSLVKELIKIESPSNISNVAVSDFLQQELEHIGFAVERLEYLDVNEVRKVSLVGKKGTGTGGLAYFAHSDTVPAETWHSSEHGPFAPAIVEQKLYGRGSCDMKGSIACMISAAREMDESQLEEPLYIAITADEEVGYLGAKQVAAESGYYREMVEAETPAIIGEPTLLEVVHAHKGSYGFRVTSRGRAAHSSTSEGINANLAMIPFLLEMKAIHEETETCQQWHDARFDPPTVSWNIGINDHTPAVNVTPPQSVCTVYFRPMPEQDPEILMQRAETVAQNLGLEFEAFRHGLPFFTEPGSPFVRQATELAGHQKSRTVSYGTDGGVLKELKHKVVLGPGSIAQAHTADEWITLKQLTAGTEMYAKFIRHYCGTQAS